MAEIAKDDRIQVEKDKITVLRTQKKTKSHVKAKKDDKKFGRYDYLSYFCTR